MGVGGRRHAPVALLPRKTRHPIYSRLGEPRAGLDGCGKPRSPMGFDPRTVQPVASCYIDWAIQVILFSSTDQFSPASTIPPLLHTHPSIYHPRCIKFFSQYSSAFPCQYHFTIVPYSSIHLPTMLYNDFLPIQFSFSLSVSFHHSSILIHPSTTHAV